MRRILAMVAVAATLLAACSDPAAPELSGQWGGSEANLQLSPAGGAIEYACGAGSIDSGWTLSASGRWHATGGHFYGGGPGMLGQPHPAEYHGQVRETMLTFAVVVDQSDTLGPFTLMRSVVRDLIRCS